MPMLRWIYVVKPLRTKLKMNTYSTKEEWYGSWFTCHSLNPIKPSRLNLLTATAIPIPSFDGAYVFSLTQPMKTLPKPPLPSTISAPKLLVAIFNSAKVNFFKFGVTICPLKSELPGNSHFLMLSLSSLFFFDDFAFLWTWKWKGKKKKRNQLVIQKLYIRYMKLLKFIDSIYSMKDVMCLCLNSRDIPGLRVAICRLGGTSWTTLPSLTPLLLLLFVSLDSSRPPWPERREKNKEQKKKKKLGSKLNRHVYVLLGIPDGILVLGRSFLRFRQQFSIPPTFSLGIQDRCYKHQCQKKNNSHYIW